MEVASVVERASSRLEFRVEAVGREIMLFMKRGEFERSEERLVSVLFGLLVGIGSRMEITVTEEE